MPRSAAEYCCPGMVDLETLVEFVYDDRGEKCRLYQPLPELMQDVQACHYLNHQNDHMNGLALLDNVATMVGRAWHARLACVY